MKKYLLHKVLVLIIVFAIASFVFMTGCSSKKSEGTIEVAGSTSVAPLAEILAEEFTAENSGVKINIQSIGSSKGITAVNDGTAVIGLSSRNLKEEEKGMGFTEYVICKDGIAVAVHPDNPVDSLTSEQIAAIFKGEITNWKDVGGNDAGIVVCNREASSGTRGAFEELMEIVDMITESALIFDGNGAMQTAVAGDPNAIGYVSFGYIDETIKTVNVNDVAATVDNVLNGTYPISRPFLLLTKEDNELAKSFIDYIMSDDGRKIIEEEGYILVE